MSDARTHTAWLLWCISEGYTKAEDRSIVPNWLEKDPMTLHDADAALRPHLLAMADEILALLPVGKLQAERDGAVDQWIMAEQEITRLGALLADPERIRREATGAAFEVECAEVHMYFAREQKGLGPFIARVRERAAGESAVTGEAT